MTIAIVLGSWIGNLFFTLLKDAFSFTNVTQSLAQQFVVTIVSVICIRAIAWLRDWKPDAKKEIALWVICCPFVLFLLLLVSSVVRTNTNEPDIKVNFDYALVGKDVLHEDKSVILVALRIANSGSPSTAWNWTLNVRLLSGQTIESKTDLPPIVPRLHPSNGKPDQEVLPSQYLPLVMLETPLLTGGAKVGWVNFYFPKELLTELQRPGVRMTLSFEDIKHKRIEATLLSPTTVTEY